MTGALDINGKKLQPIKEVIGEVSYSRDYITRLAREGKIVGAHIGRQWYVDLGSLKTYEMTSQAEQEVRKKNLSKERKREQRTESVRAHHDNKREKSERTLHARALVATSLVLSFGLLTGWTTDFFLHGAPIQSTEDSSVEISMIDHVPSPGQVVAAAGQSDSDSEIIDNVAPEPEPLTASKSVTDIGDDVRDGILLLPQGTIGASTTDYFSDQVVILTAEDGTKSAVRVDESGVPVGGVIPFIEVPVSNGSNI